MSSNEASVHLVPGRGALALQRVAKSYASGAGRAEVLRGIDVELDPGQLIALVGRSGSGKSTLLNLIGGIDRPSSGSVVVAGTALESLSEEQLTEWRGASVGFVFQFFQLLPTLTAVENVMLPMDFVGRVPARERRRKALALLDRAGIAAHCDKLPAALSGGEQQRVAIARALANDPKLVLADEPTGNLDAATAREVLALLRSCSAGGSLVLIVTHDAEVARSADRTLTLADGRLTTDSAAASNRAPGAA